MCLGEIELMEQTGAGHQADCLPVDFLRNSAIDRSKEGNCVMKLMSMLAFGLGRSYSGSSDAAFIWSRRARPNLTHFIHSVLLPS